MVFVHVKISTQVTALHTQFVSVCCYSIFVCIISKLDISLIQISEVRMYRQVLWILKWPLYTVGIRLVLFKVDAQTKLFLKLPLTTDVNSLHAQRRQEKPRHERFDYQLIACKTLLLLWEENYNYEYFFKMTEKKNKIKN